MKINGKEAGDGPFFKNLIGWILGPVKRIKNFIGKQWSRNRRILQSDNFSTWPDEADSRLLDDGHEAGDLVADQSHRLRPGLVVLDGAGVEPRPGKG